MRRLLPILFLLLAAPAWAQTDTTGTVETKSVLDVSRLTLAVGLDYVAYAQGDGTQTGFEASETQEFRPTAKMAWSLGRRTSLVGGLDYGLDTELLTVLGGIRFVVMPTTPSLAVGINYCGYDAPGTLPISSTSELQGAVYVGYPLHPVLDAVGGVTYGAQTTLTTWYIGLRAVLFRGHETL